MTNNESLVEFSKKVGVVSGAIIAAGTIVQFVGGFLWGYATKPITDSISSLTEHMAVQSVRLAEESTARRQADSLMVEQIASLAKFIAAPSGSERERRAVDEVLAAPQKLQEQAP